MVYKMTGEPGISNDTVSLKREDGNFSGGLVTVIY
jgi:hypothetical protein